ncbi:putative drug/proton antiporter [Venturia nashicola]|nr:putative drug/proton antiporter [Venturia nashicola]
MLGPLNTLILAAFAATSIAAPAPFPVANPKPQSWYGNGPSYNNNNNNQPPPSSWFGPPAAAPVKPAGITFTGPSGSSSFGSDGSFALTSSNSPFGVSYNPGQKAPPSKGYGPWRSNAVTGKDSEETQVGEEAWAGEEVQAAEDSDTVEEESSVLSDTTSE